jgi:hypothetical protein
MVGSRPTRHRFFVISKVSLLQFGFTDPRKVVRKSCPERQSRWGWAMMRYFFDLDTQCQSMYDYQGRELATPEAAYQLAELIALDLALDGESVGWTVAVCNPEGKRFFSVPVRDAELVNR